MKHRAELIHDNVEKQNSAIHQRVLDAFSIDASKYNALETRDKNYNEALAKQRKGIALNATEQAAINAGPLTGSDKAFFDAGRQAMSFTLADAISSRRKVDKEASGVYYELYDDSPAGTVPGDALTSALENGDYNSMSAAISVMAKRGDHKDIMDILRDNSDKISSNTPENIRFQKEINDACLALKPDNQILWAWAKSNMIRRGKYNHAEAEGKHSNLAPFIDFDSFINGSRAAGDTIGTLQADGTYTYTIDEKEAFNMINMESILTNVRDGKVFAGADRTMFNYFTKAGINGKVEPAHYYFTDIKHLRNSACSGLMDGEQLAAFNNYFTMNYNEKHDRNSTNPSERAAWANDNAFFLQNKEMVHKNLHKYFADMTANQLAGVKTATLLQFNKALLALNNDGVDVGGGEISKEILDALDSQIKQLSADNMVEKRSGMNQAVRKMLGISLND
jgi:hypothetical protein